MSRGLSACCKELRGIHPHSALSLGQTSRCVGFDDILPFTSAVIRKALNLLSWHFNGTSYDSSAMSQLLLSCLSCFMKRLSCYGFATITCDYIFLHGLLWRCTIQQGSTWALLLFLLYCWHLCYLASWAGEAEGFSKPAEWYPSEHLIHDKYRKYLPVLDSDIYKRLIIPWLT